ncbi:MAG: HAMP domain-containing sensor histidine kinase [Micropepsaceae bacterium]
MVGAIILVATLYNLFVSVRQVDPGPFEISLNVALMIATASSMLLPRSRAAWWAAQVMSLLFIAGTVLINYAIGGAPERTLLWMPWLAVVYLQNAGWLAPRTSLVVSGCFFVASLGLFAFFAIVDYISPGMPVFDALVIMALFHLTLILMLFNVARRNAFEIAWRARAETAREIARTQARIEAELSATRLALAEECGSLSVAMLAESVAHEIRQPLTSIATGATAALNWLRHEPPDAGEAAACAERILSDARRAGEIVTATRDLIRREVRPREAVDTGAMIAEVASILHDEADMARVALSVQAGAAPLTVDADPAQLRQLLVNLAKNAIEASIGCDTRVVTLSSQAYRGEIVLAVEDRGIGFGEEGHSRAFEAFFSTKPGGMGLGLVIARSIAEAHGGRIAAMALIQGARVTVTLPAAAA